MNTLPAPTGAFAHLIRRKAATLTVTKPKPAPAAKAPAAKHPAAPTPPTFEHLLRARGNDLDAMIDMAGNLRSVDARADSFANEMEVAMAQADGRDPRTLDAGPSQAHLDQPLGADDIVAVLERRDASRAARRFDRTGRF